MKEKEVSKLYNSITNVDNQFIEKAQIKSKKNGWLKWGSLAACFVIVAAIGIETLWKLNDYASSQQDVDIYFLSESGAMESKTVHIPNDSKDIFNEWATVNNVSNVLLVDCLYDAQGNEIIQKDNDEGYSTLSLTVSPEFSKYVSNENGIFLIETLRRTFYENNRFDNMNLIIESLTDNAISNGIVEPGMQADDGRELVWCDMSEREIDGTECYSFELRFSDDEQKNGEMASRLIGIYAVSNDGTKFYQYNMADDTWN